MNQFKFMQAQKPSNTTSLQQGSIFKLKDLKLNKTREPSAVAMPIFGKGGFYPEVATSDDDFGIVFSQSCDIYCNEAENRRAKAPYLTVGILESFDKYLNSSAFEHFHMNDFSIQVKVNDGGLDKNYIFFSKPKLDSKFLKQFKEVIQNNDPFLFFAMLPVQPKKTELYVTNLLKIFPIKVVHYQQILTAVQYELTTEFANKMAWKIASLFGQIGTQDMKQSDISNVCTDLASKFQSLLQTKGNYIPVSDSQLEKAKYANSKKKSERLEIIKSLIDELEDETTN